MMAYRQFISSLALLGAALLAPAGAAEKPIHILFLGDNGHHVPARRFLELAPQLQERGLELKYTDRLTDLNDQTLARFDGLMVYANIDRIEPEQEKAILNYVAAGHGFIPLHCASFCFRNSDALVALTGGQFQKHGTGVFRVKPAVDHPLVRGYQGFESWDETYVHTKHNEKDRTVLEFRVEGEEREPWTWVRTHGKGRVFYTAWGHDERTWTHPGFHNLVERGTRWAVGQDPGAAPAYVDAPPMTAKRTDLKPFEYEPGLIPFYPPSAKWGTQADPVTKVQKPLPPAESQKHFITPQGFQVVLFASEPNIGKPQSMTWDERGRLWLCETVDYPNQLQPEGEGHDRIRICEDTNGDGQADKFTVFAEGLSIPQAITPFRGGVIVQNGTQTLYLKDTNGDDKADLRQTLITGWGQGDTHGGVSNFQYGHDNWIYAMQGYNQSEPVAAGKSYQSFRQGFWRFRLSQRDPPEVLEIEFLRSTNNNTWGLGLSEEGLVFGSTANGNPSEFMPIPNRYYEQVRGWSSSVLGGISGDPQFFPIAENVRQVDHHGKFTAAAGHALYTARAWPPEYWNRTAFVTEPTGHLIATFNLAPQGGGFRSRNAWNILASTDEWSAPIMAEVGPDGQLWVIDWYNIIVQHNPTPAGFKTGKGNAYEIPLRDKKHGRIYRVVYSGQPAAKAASPALSSLSGATGELLVKALANDNMLWRRQAQRLLLERDDRSLAPLLIALARSTEVDSTGQNPGVVHALWTLHGLGLLAGDKANAEAMAAAVGGLRHTASGVRRNAALVLPRTAEMVAALRESGVLVDRHAQVRLAAWLALAEMPPAAEAGSLAVAGLLGNAAALGGQESEGASSLLASTLSDRWLRDAVVAASARHDRFVLPQLLAQATANPPAAQNAQSLEVVAIVTEHYARGAPVAEVGSLVEALAKSARSPLAAQIVAGLVKGWPNNQPAKLRPESEQALAALFAELPAEARPAVVTLAARWGSKAMEQHVSKIVAAFLATVKSEKETDEARIAAAAQLVDFQRASDSAAEQVLAAITPRTSPALAQGLLSAAARSEAAPVGKMLADLVPSLTPQSRPIALRALLARTDWTPALLDALDAGSIQLADLALDQRQALADHPNAAIAKRARALIARGGGLPDADRQKVLAELAGLAERVGNPGAGKEVFKKQCSKCHMHSGEGNKIGPDLTGMAVHPKHELLIHLLDPSRSVEGNFRVYTVVLESGQVLTGLLASESKTALEIVDAEAKRHSVQREEVDRLVASTKSLMPEGFEKQVPQEDIVNLLEFLTQRGKFVPIPLDKSATVVSTQGMFFNPEGEVERLVFPDWKPKEFAGVPFVLVDPEGDKRKNAILLYGPNGTNAPKMPKQVKLPCNGPARAIHMLSGVGGWSFPASEKGTVSLIVRLHYADGKTEDHSLINGEHFADYIRVVDVPKSKLAFQLRGQQIRYLAVTPQRPDPIQDIELVKGPDATAPVVMAVTVESP